MKPEFTYDEESNMGYICLHPEDKNKPAIVDYTVGHGMISFDYYENGLLYRIEIEFPR